MVWKIDWKKFAVIYGTILLFTIYVNTLAGVALFLLSAIGLGGALISRMDKVYEAVLNETEVVNDPDRLLQQGFEPLENVLAQAKSLRDPRAGKVIFEYLSLGYEVRLCSVAKDRWGKIIPDKDILSVWGKLATM